MDQLEEQALNQKLAEWIFPPPRFRVQKVQYITGIHDYIAVEERFGQEIKDYMLQKENFKLGDWHWIKGMSLPTRSLDACWKSLIPKWVMNTGRDSISIPTTLSAEETALVICKEIEKQIDKENS